MKYYVCPTCGKKFEPFYATSKTCYCSKECKNEKRKLINKATREKIKKRIESGDIDLIANMVRDRYARCAKKRGQEMNLSLDFFKRHVGSNCHYCGDKLKKVGFDRIDNSIGYTESNVVVCCVDCNFMRRLIKYDDFLNRISRIYHNRICPDSKSTIG